jgi:hypothetical protein
VRSALVLVWLTGTAAAGPVATLVADVDGDGSDDKIELDAGELRIDTRKGASKLALAVTGRATLAGGVARGTPTIVVQTDREGYVVQRTGAAWKQVAKTKLGGVGLDADYSLALDVSSEGVYRYQARPGYRRCDGRPALLFAERLEGSTFKTVSTLPTFVPASAQVIAARVESQAATVAAPQMFKARFASHQPGAPDAGALAIPAELDDGNPRSVWREDLAGAAEGHFVTYLARMKGAKATQLRLVPARIKNLNRPQRIGVVGAQGAWHVDLPDSAKESTKNPVYVIDLPSPIADCVTLVIESTYGTAGATAFAELQLWSENELGAGDAMFAKMIAAGGDDAHRATQLLGARGAAGVAAIEAELKVTTDAATRTRLVRALIGNSDASRAPLLARAAGEGWLAGKELVHAIDALAGLGQGQALHDLAARQAIALDARAAAVRALDPSVEKERDLLVALAGRGPRELRQAVIEVLTQVPVAILAPLAASQPKPTASGDLWRAITRRAHANKDERAPALAALTAALATATDYERRYRLVDGIAAVGDGAALRALEQLFATWPADAETAAIKQIAARAISVNPRGDAFELIVSLVADADPGVRLAALAAIATGGAAATAGAAGPWHGPAGAPGTDRVIITRLATDSWPEVRRYAAQVLGIRCTGPGSSAALTDSVARDPDLAVRGAALAAMVECKAPGVAVVLEKLWDDGKAPIELRQRAVDLVVTLDDRVLGQKLLAKYARWRSAAIESHEALALAQNAAYTIGRLRLPGAAEALIAGLDDSAFPELVAAAATGLGLLGRACPARARPKLNLLARSDEQQVRIAASRAVEVCGK